MGRKAASRRVGPEEEEEGEEKGASESATEGVRRLVKVKVQVQVQVKSGRVDGGQDRKEAPTGRLRLLEGGCWNAGCAGTRRGSHTKADDCSARPPRRLNTQGEEGNDKGQGKGKAAGKANAGRELFCRQR